MNRYGLDQKTASELFALYLKKTQDATGNQYNPEEIDEVRQVFEASFLLGVQHERSQNQKEIEKLKELLSEQTNTHDNRESVK